MKVIIKLNKILDANKITRNALAREAKVRPNLIYDMYDGKTRRIDLETLAIIIATLRKMGVDCEVSDILEYIPDGSAGE